MHKGRPNLQNLVGGIALGHQKRCLHGPWLEADLVLKNCIGRLCRGIRIRISHEWHTEHATHQLSHTGAHPLPRSRACFRQHATHAAHASSAVKRRKQRHGELRTLSRLAAQPGHVDQSAGRPAPQKTETDRRTQSWALQSASLLGLPAFAALITTLRTNITTLRLTSQL